ncbi:MAG: hypothetical protein F6J93_32355 [Oscillatoria sp. SIO1A7]|nr:hypothetical protein [Oscillatoria sp. SIO1A7]
MLYIALRFPTSYRHTLPPHPTATPYTLAMLPFPQSYLSWERPDLLSSPVKDHIKLTIKPLATAFKSSDDCFS